MRRKKSLVEIAVIDEMRERSRKKFTVSSCCIIYIIRIGMYHAYFGCELGLWFNFKADGFKSSKHWI